MSETMTITTGSQGAMLSRWKISSYTSEMDSVVESVSVAEPISTVIESVPMDSDEDENTLAKSLIDDIIEETESGD